MSYLLGDVGEKQETSDIVTVSVSRGNQCTEKFYPDCSENICVLRDFDKSLKYVRYEIQRECDDVLNYNIPERMLSK